jgi:RNA polymerase sigma-70 factor (ECF subfamily)
MQESRGISLGARTDGSLRDIDLHQKDALSTNAIRTPREWGVWLQVRHWNDLQRTAAAGLFGYAKACAEDIVAETIADMLAGKFSTMPQTEMELLFFTKAVVRNKARVVNRGERRLTEMPAAGAVVSMSLMQDAWRLAVRAQTIRDVRGALDGLSHRERQMVVLHSLDGESIGRIAETLGISRHTAKECLRRARGKLRKSLERYRPASERERERERALPRSGT